jgi:hypothetical protein
MGLPAGVSQDKSKFTFNWRISDPSILAAARDIVNDVCGKAPHLASHRVPLNLLRVIILSLELSQFEVNSAIETLKNCESEIFARLPPFHPVRFQGLEVVPGKGLFARIDDDSAARLAAISSLLKEGLAAKGIHLLSPPFRPQVSLIYNRSHAPIEIPPFSYAHHVSKVLGTFPLDALRLSRSTHVGPIDDYYPTLFFLPNIPRPVRSALSTILSMPISPITTAIILRGLPGSGKTSLAREILSRAPNAVMCSAAYHHAPKAYQACFIHFQSALGLHHPLIVVDNTNHRKHHYEKYVVAAQQASCRVVVLDMVCGGFEEVVAFHSRCTSKV